MDEVIEVIYKYSIVAHFQVLSFYLKTSTSYNRLLPIGSLGIGRKGPETTLQGGPDPQGAQRALRPPLRGPTGSICPPRPRIGKKGQKGLKGLKSAENGPGSPKRAFGASGQASGKGF